MNILTTTTELSNFCQPLLEAKEPVAIGIDTEFIRVRTYWPKLCLIQITSPLTKPDEIVLIDPLLGLDLTPFVKLLSASHIIKVIHSARQDLEIFWHEWSTLPQAFFDTQIAAIVCGLGDGIGYGTLVKTLFDVDLEKESQYTDWSRRPLSDKQITYAQADVQYLLPAYENLKDKLTQLNRWAWMEDDLANLLSPSTYNIDPNHAWLRIHSHRHKPQNLSYMQEVCAWREINANRLNVNRGRLLRDECVLKIGLAQPQTLDELKELADSQSLTDALAEELFEIYKEAMLRPKETWPQAPKKTILSLKARHRLETLRDKLNEVATNLNVPARLIAPKHDLIALAEGKTNDNRILTGWRYEVFGHLIENTNSSRE